MIKYTFIFISLILLPISMSSQAESSIDFSMGVGMSIGSEYLSSDKHKINENINFSYSRQLSKNILLTTGLEYSRHRFKRDSPNYISSTIIPGPSGPDIQSLFIFESAISGNTHNFFGVPIALRFQKNSKKLNPFIEVGTSLNYYSRPDIVDRGRKKNVLNSFGLVAIGVNYQFVDHFQIFTKFRYNAVLNSINNGASAGNNISVIDYNDRLQDYGIVIGVRKLLNLVKEPID